jgi:4-hydroxybenzoate polyprenyltransferase
MAKTKLATAGGSTGGREISGRALESSKNAAEAQAPIWLEYLRLLRAPNVFTAVADVTMGYVAVTAGNVQIPTLAILIAASAMLYMAGMVLNDVFDVEVDRKERPHRPLPSKRIPMASATRLGWGLLAGGIVLAIVAGAFAMRDDVTGQGALFWRPGLIGIGLAAAIVLYDRFAKATVAGPLVMGSCRLLNVLLGMSVAAPFPGMSLLALGYDAAEWTIALGIGTYVVGLTCFARTEAERPSKAWLILGTVLMAVGVFFLAWWPRYAPFDMPLRISADYLLPGLLLVISAFAVFGECIRAIRHPKPENVQYAVKWSILALILFDATLILALGTPMQAAGVGALYIAALLVGSAVYST